MSYVYEPLYHCHWSALLTHNLHCWHCSQHVAGTIGGKQYGVAKKVTLYAVKVLAANGRGAFSGIIAGLEYVGNQKDARPGTSMVANLSLGARGQNRFAENAVNTLRAKGVVVVIAAGNDNIDACGYTPARAVDAITVGATTSSDARSGFSNHGTCLDLFAPGSGIRSAWKGSNSATYRASGTSMAAPHVAGVACLYGQALNADADEIEQAMLADTLPNVVSGAQTGSPNLLLQLGQFLVDGVTPTDAPISMPSLSPTDVLSASPSYSPSSAPVDSVPKPLGEFCEGHDECESGRCDGKGSWGFKICSAKMSFEDNCNEDYDCFSNLCIDGMCSALKKHFEDECDEDSDCATMRCEGNRPDRLCKRRLQEGKVCTRGSTSIGSING